MAFARVAILMPIAQQAAPDGHSAPNPGEPESPAPGTRPRNSTTPRPEGNIKLTMDQTINAKQLRASLPETVRRVQRGERFTVLYRSRPAFRIVPVEEEFAQTALSLAEDPIYRAPAVGRSSDGWSSRDHDRILYGARGSRKR